MRAQRGSAGLAVLVAVTLAGGAALGMVAVATDLAVAAVRARTAAEAAALAAVGTSPLAGGAGDPVAAARQAATANDAELVTCCATGAPLEAEATVAVDPGSALLPRLRARARAGLRPPLHVPAAPAGSGRLLAPVEGVITSGYGWRVHPIFGTRRFHAGVDLAAPTGAPVRAADGGTVTFAGPRGGYGLTVIVDHGDGLATLYAHLSRIDGRAGRAVERGQTIGAVGSTGRSTGPHLHFEVRLQGNAQDPTDYL